MTNIIMHSDEWQNGFEAGMVYALMLSRCPYMTGLYHSINEEDLFLFASQMGYETSWKLMKHGLTAIEFTLRDVEL